MLKKLSLCGSVSITEKRDKSESPENTGRSILLLEDKTTETRQGEPAAAPRHTGFRAKLRSLWAQLQCVHLLRRHRRYRRRRHRLDNASRKLRSSKLVLRIGAALYALGFGAEYAAVRVGRAVKYAALWVAGGIRRFAKALAETAFSAQHRWPKTCLAPSCCLQRARVPSHPCPPHPQGAGLRCSI